MTGKLVIPAGMAIVVIVIVDFLATRQMFPYDNFSGAVLFALNISIAFGIGSGIILRHVKNLSQDVRKKSMFLDWTFKTLTAAMLAILAILVAMFILFYCYNVSVRYLTYTVFSISTIVASVMMGATSFKFFSWYRLSNKNNLLLVCGMAAVTLAAAMIFDAGSKLLLVRVVEEKSSVGAIPEEAWIYRQDEKYQGEVQYKVVKPDSTTLYIVPQSIRMIYSYVNGWIPITVSFAFTWAITTMLLRQYYQKVGRLPIVLWLVLVAPLIFYTIGRTPDWYSALTGQIWHWEDFENPYLLKSIFRAAVIGGSILFGIAFFLIAKRVKMGKVKDYLIIAAIGATIMGITLGPSAQQQTFGVAGRSLMLLASFLLSFGFYLSAVSLAQDNRLRRSLRGVVGTDMLRTIGLAELELHEMKNILQIIEKERQSIQQQTNISPPLEGDVQAYVDTVIKEIYRAEARIRETRAGATA
jgi:hypothetical protein